MSFSSIVKREIFNAPGGDRHCRLAMLAAIINGAARIRTNEDEGAYVTIKTENGFMAKKFFDIVKYDFKYKCAVDIREGAVGKSYVISLENGSAADKILKATGLKSEGGYVRHINTMVVKSDCCRRAYTAGTFLVCGYLSNPRKTYHCEFVAGDGGYAEELSELLAGFGLTPRRVLRKGRWLVYFKDGEQISEILGVTGAHMSLMQYENIRIRKDMDNKINRSVNCDSANLDKSIAAAVRQIESINIIQQSVGLSSLAPSLLEIALARLDNPEISLKEIGEKLTPPVGKSGVSHRLRKIQHIADKIRENQM